MFGNLGVNLDPLNPAGRPPVGDLAKFGWARVIVRRGSHFAEYVDELRGAGVRVLAVLARESFESDDPGLDQIHELSRHYAERLVVDAWQLCNEPDAGFDPSKSDEENAAHVRQLSNRSSWCMDPAPFAQAVFHCADAIRGVQPTATLITAGLSSGQPDWLARCGALPVDGVAIHPYGQRPTASLAGWDELPGNFGFVGNLLGAYGNFGLPLWVTEVGVNTLEASRELQAKYCGEMMSLLRDRPDVVAGFWFCYSDGMVPEFGLLDADGVAKPAFDSFPA